MLTFLSEISLSFNEVTWLCVTLVGAALWINKGIYDLRIELIKAIDDLGNRVTALERELFSKKGNKDNGDI